MRKRVAWSAPVALADVKAIGAPLGAKINDVLVAGMTGALRTYLRRRGVDVNHTTVRAMVPVDLRPPERTDRLGNEFGVVLLELAIGSRQRLQRVLATKAAMDELKRSPEPVAALALFNLMGRLPKAVEDIGAQMFQRKASVVMTNVAGPQERIHLAGVPIERVMFWVPHPGKEMGMGISILSYCGTATLAVIADAHLVPDPEAITRRVQSRVRGDAGGGTGEEGTGSAREGGAREEANQWSARSRRGPHALQTCGRSEGRPSERATRRSPTASRARGVLRTGAGRAAHRSRLCRTARCRRTTQWEAGCPRGAPATDRNRRRRSLCARASGRCATCRRSCGSSGGPARRSPRPGLLRLVRALLPVVTLYVGKLIIDEVVLLAQARRPRRRPARLVASGALDRIGWLLALEFGLAVLSDVLGRIVSLVDSLLSERFSNATSVRLMEHAATLDLEDFEDSELQDKLERARRQASGRMS